MNTRRRILVALGVGAIAPPRRSFAQQHNKVWRIGFLGSQTAAGNTREIDALRGGLKDYGYVEGKNVVIAYRWADGANERLPQLAAELLAEKVDVLVTSGVAGVSAAQRATTSIPIVIASLGIDPVSAGLVKSLARPGGNLTGSLSFSATLTTKQLELVKDVFPNARTVASMVTPSAAEQLIKSMEAAAKALKLDLLLVRLSNINEFETAIAAMTERRVDALIVAPNPLLGVHAARIAELAARHRIPSMGTVRFADSGGMIGYGVNNLNGYRRAAYFFDRIVKGAKPAELPIEQPTGVELVVNLKVAKSIGVRIPDTVMARADRVIE